MIFMSLHKKTVGILKNIFLSPKLYLITRVIIGSIFIYAGFVKLTDPKTFAKTISQFDVVPEILLAPLAIGLPSLELLAGLGLIFNIRGSLTVIFNLLFVFILVLGYGIFNDMDIDCGCFSVDEINAYNSLRQALFRDFLMITAVFYLYLYRRIKHEAKTTHLYGKNEIQYKEESA